MINNKEFQTYLLEDLLRGDTAYTTKAMFGSVMLYKKGIPVGIIHNGVFYLKVVTKMTKTFLSQKELYFSYKVNGKDIFLSYMRVPDEEIESGEQLEVRIEHVYRITLAQQKNKSTL